MDTENWIFQGQKHTLGEAKGHGHSGILSQSDLELGGVDILTGIRNDPALALARDVSRRRLQCQDQLVLIKT